ncbi:MAG: carboxylating nicotinate-nucleotide diphosphorylase [FCB group bacterium]|nr:carboxylating nicotinate-nucleotide diphosphorylase [FCB group bacterium]
MLYPDSDRVDAICKAALEEDLGSGDVTTLAIRSGMSAKADIISKQEGVLAGIDVAKRVFELLDPALDINCLKKDGDLLKKGDTVLSLSGSGSSMLGAERTALNLLGRMSGIATLTRAYVDKLRGTGCKILDTRKTMPNLRILDKYAVTCGGGENHRFGLYDMILIKENHIRWAGGIEKALVHALAYARPRELKIEIEVTDLDEFETALAYPVDMIMLDHFSLDDMRRAVALNTKGILLEASGNMGLEHVRAVAETGVHVISVGALTHSATCFDFSLLFHVS